MRRSYSARTRACPARGQGGAKTIVRRGRGTGERYQWKVCQKTLSARQGTMFEGRSLACRADRDSGLAPPKSNLRFPQLAVVSVFRWSIPRKLARAMNTIAFLLPSVLNGFLQVGSDFPHPPLQHGGFARADSIPGRGRCRTRKMHRCSVGDWQPTTDGILLPLAFKGVFVGTPPTQHAFSPLLLWVRGCRVLLLECGSPPLFRKRSRCTLFYRKDVERVRKGGMRQKESNRQHGGTPPAATAVVGAITNGQGRVPRLPQSVLAASGGA